MISLRASLLCLSLVGAALAGEPKIDWQPGRCLGGNQPSMNCKSCATCAYCGKKPGRIGKGDRTANSATCAVCEKRAMKAAR